MRVLVACEFSGVVREAFRRLGHEAWSCDLLESEDGSEFHIKDDVLDHLEDGWDLMIAHPPCTYLSSSGLHWNGRVPGRELKTHEAVIFATNLMGDGFIDNPIPHIAMENPIGCLSTRYRKPDQIIQPYWFGEDASKSTCLWLRDLPKLSPTQYVEPVYGCSCGARFPYELGKYGCPSCLGEGKVRQIWSNQTPTGQNKLGPSAHRSSDRSRTYLGIAEAMAKQWSEYLLRDVS